MSISPTFSGFSVRKPEIFRLHMMWVKNVHHVQHIPEASINHQSSPELTKKNESCVLYVILQKRSGMDIQQIKTFVSEELKGLKQEHRLLSLRESYIVMSCFHLQIVTFLLWVINNIVHFRYRCQWINDEEEDKAGIPGAVENRTL